MSRAPEFVPLSDEALRAVAGANSRQFEPIMVNFVQIGADVTALTRRETRRAPVARGRA